jgi:hypothetical protein
MTAPMTEARGAPPGMGSSGSDSRILSSLMALKVARALAMAPSSQVLASLKEAVRLTCAW